MSLKKWVIFEIIIEYESNGDKNKNLQLGKYLNKISLT